MANSFTESRDSRNIDKIREIEDGKRPISRKNIWDLGRRFYRIF